MNLEVGIVSGGEIDVVASSGDSGIDVDTGTICRVSDTPDIESYKGSYQVTPKFSEQVLQTRGKQLSDDVVVKPIQIHETTNSSGGTTVYIAMETGV